MTAIPQSKITVDKETVESNLRKRLTNVLMRNGKKRLAERIIQGAFKRLALKLVSQFPDKPLKGRIAENQLLEEILEIARPRIEVRRRRIGANHHQIPVELPLRRQTSLALRWIIQSARSRSENTMEARLAGEFNDILLNEGITIRKRDELHKVAEANRAFSRFRWN
uniref:Ribosomal protein S7 n=1 Tax=Ancoracysta twista TaxID=2044563 RepID=A0A2H4R8D2_9EUKA|nr:ribosomal protein S7 [Ancoracysta twista]ATY40909.1 ribosomal protein S7 [Ancoracysta twista]